LNLEYLRSGAQFLPAAAPDGRSDLDPEAPASATQRLTRFHDATASAAAAAAKKNRASKSNVRFVNVNVAFLRSGRQFSRGVRCADRPSGVAASVGVARTTAAQRLDRFYAKTSLAAAMANKLAPPVTVRPAVMVAAAPTAAGINIDFLRSGRQFAPKAPAMRRSSPEQSRNQRLEKFYQGGLEEAPAAPVPARNRRISSSRAGVNVEFLRSGKQFVVRGDGPVRPSGEGAAKSTNARLEEFFARTLAAAKAPLRPAPTQSPSAPMLNINYLRSGAQFKQPFAASQPQPAVRVRQTRDQRLAEFHAQSQAAAATVLG